MRPGPSDAALARLEADGLLRRDAARYRTTRRWQAAMARAAAQLMRAGDDGEDLRVPVAYALLELYADGLSDAEVAALVDALTPIEAEELEPARRLARADGDAAEP